MATDDYARTRLEHGDEFPYHGEPAKDWAERAALGVLADLCDRRGIKHELQQIEGDEDITREIVATLGTIIRTAHADSIGVIQSAAAAPLLPKFAVGEEIQLGPRGAVLEIMSVSVAYTIGTGGHEIARGVAETALERAKKKT